MSMHQVMTLAAIPIYPEALQVAWSFTIETTLPTLNHATDPICGKLCNAFDLVRLHKFGELDDEAKDGTPVNKLPSYMAMQRLATEDLEVKKQVAARANGICQ